MPVSKTPKKSPRIPKMRHHKASGQALVVLNGRYVYLGKWSESEPVQPVLDAHVQAVKPFVTAPVWGMFQVQLFSGARPGEIVKLRALDLDTSGEVWTAKRERHKNSYRGKTRVLCFGPRAQNILREFMASRPLDAPIFSPRDAFAERAARADTHRRSGQKPTPRQTARVVGDSYDVASYRRAIARACEQAGIEPWSPH